MDNLCPFFKAECHGHQCMMWKNEECLIVAFLQEVQGSASKSENEVSSEENSEMETAISHRETAKVPSWLKTATPESLAKDMLEFKDEEFQKDEPLRFYSLANLFWSKKGVERFFLPSEIQLKIEQANMKAQMQLQKEEEDKKRARLADEKEELSSLVCKCVDWARVSGLKRLSLSDVDTFILEKDIDILKETKKALYSTANVKMKTGK